MTEKKVYPNPHFKTAEEEEKYWESHSPLLEGYEARKQRGATTRGSFLSVRMSGKEIELLRQTAARHGIGSTTLARNLILQGLQAQEAAKEVASRVRDLEERVVRLEQALSSKR